MRSRTLTILSIALNVALLSLFAWKYLHRPHPGPSSADAARNAYYDMWDSARNSVYNTLSIDTGDVVFVGTSLTEGFPVAEVFHSANFKNRGIGGNQTKHILGRIREITQGKPGKIFLDAGVNDIISGVPIDTLFAPYQEIVHIIRNESPRTHLYVQSVFPVGAAHKDSEPLVEAFNARLRSYCAQNNIDFIDIFPLLVKNGLLDKTCTFDDLHLNGKGYEIWKNAISAAAN